MCKVAMRKLRAAHTNFVRSNPKEYHTKVNAIFYIAEKVKETGKTELIAFKDGRIESC